MLYSEYFTILCYIVNISLFCRSFCKRL